MIILKIISLFSNRDMTFAFETLDAYGLLHTSALILGTRVPDCTAPNSASVQPPFGPSLSWLKTYLSALLLALLTFIHCFSHEILFSLLWAWGILLHTNTSRAEEGGCFGYVF